MTKLFLVALPLAVVLAEVPFEELSAPAGTPLTSAPAAVQSDVERRLVGPEWTWPVDPWKSNHWDCPWSEPRDRQQGSNSLRGRTCNYDKVCCPFDNCVASKQATCNLMLPYGCSWEVKAYGRRMWKNGVCHIIHAGKKPTPRPTPRPTPPPVHDSKYRSLGSGKCLTPMGADPPHKYLAGLDDRQCKRKCNERSDCGGYSVSGARNCLLWLNAGLVGGGDSWDGATCNVKEAHVSYRSRGRGKCVTSWGADPPHKYLAGLGDQQCKQKCNQRVDCGGYSVSGANNCLLWLNSALVGGGDSWDGATCNVKIISG